jgi:integrase
MIDPADLFAPDSPFTKFADVVPGLPPINVYFLQFLILNGARFQEVRYMRWSEYDPVTKRWTIPWQRMKKRNEHGHKEIRFDHVIPLGKRSIEIITMLDEQRQRDRNLSEFVFGNYRTANNRSSRIGKPICAEITRRLLQRILKALAENAPKEPAPREPVSARATLHGMRTTMASWARSKGYPENDVQYLLAHIGAFGPTEIERNYGRLMDRIERIRLIFERYESDIMPAPADVLPFRKQVK